MVSRHPPLRRPEKPLEALGDDDFAPLRDEPVRRGPAGRAMAEDHDPAAHRLAPHGPS
jgi:hypothetical protein